MKGMVLSFCWDVAHKVGVAVLTPPLNGKELSHFISFPVEPIGGGKCASGKQMLPTGR